MIFKCLVSLTLVLSFLFSAASTAAPSDMDAKVLIVTDADISAKYPGQGTNNVVKPHFIEQQYAANIDTCTAKYNYCIASCDKQKSSCVSNGNNSSYCDAGYNSCSVSCENLMHECWKE